MLKNGQISNEETIHAWADITLKIWRAKLTELNVYDQGNLYKSLLNTLTISAGNNVSKVEFSFKLYGIFVDMGVGKEISKGNGGDLGFTPNRKRKEWYSNVFYREVMILHRILLEKYSKDVADQIVFSMKPIRDLKYAHANGTNVFNIVKQQ